MTGYNVSLQGNIIGFKKVSSAITQYNALSASGAKEQNIFANAVSVTNGKLGTYLTGLNGAKASLGGYVISLVGATVKTVALKAATIALNSALTMGVSFIVSSVVSAISSYINRTEIMAEKADEARVKIQSLNEELKEEQKFISDSAKRYAELAQGVDQLTGKNISLSNEDYEEFLNLSNQIAEIFPELPRIYKENGNAIVQLSGDVDTIVGSLQNLIEAQRDLTNRQIVDELPTVFKDIASKSNQYEQQLSDLESRRDALVKSLGDVQSEEFSSNFMDGFSNKWIEISGDNLEVISQMRDDYMKILKEANIDFEELTPTYEMKDGIEVPVGFTIKINSSDEDVEKAKNTIDGKIQELASQYKTDINKLNEEIITTNEKNKTNWTSLSSSIFAWLSTDDSFKVMDDTMQATMQNIVNSLDWGSLDFSSWEGAKQYIQENILSLFNTTEGKETLADIEVMFGIQTQFNNGDITVEQYQQKLQDFLNSIENLPPETKKSILLLFGIQTNDDGTTTSDVDTMVENVKKKLKGTEFDDKVRDLSLGDLKIAADLKVGDDTIQSWDDLIERIEKVKSEGNETDISNLFDIDFSTQKDEIDDFQTKLNSLSETYSQLLKGDYTASDLIDILQELNELGVDLSLINSVEELDKKILELNTDNVEKLIDTLNVNPDSSLANYLKTVADEAIKVESAFKGVTSALSNIESGYSTVANAIKEYNENGTLTISTLNKVLELEPEYLSCLRDENGQLTINTDAYVKLGKVQIDKAKQTIVDEAITKLNKLAHDNLAVSIDKADKSENTFIDTIKNGIEKFKNYTTNIWNTIKSKLSLIKVNYAENVAETIKDSVDTETYESEIEKAYRKAAKVNQKIADEIMSDMNTKLDFVSMFENNIAESLKSSNSSSSSSSEDTTDYWKQEFDAQLATLKHQLEMDQITETQYYNTLDGLNKKYFANRTEYLDEYRQYEEEVYKGFLSLYTEAFDKELSGLKHSLEMNYITEAEYYSKLEKLNNQYFKDKTEYLDEYQQYEEEIYKGLLSLQQDAISSIDKLIDLRKEMIKDMKEDEIDTLKEVIDAEKKKLDAINEAIDARKKAIELVKDEKDHDEEMAERNKAISDIQIQIDRLALDNSAAAQKKKRELEEQLAEKKKDLADYIADYEYDKAMEALDNEAEIAEQEYEQLEENLNNQIDKIQAYLDDEKQLMQDAINDINDMNNSLFESMKTWAYETTGSVWEVVDAWKAAKEALETYNATNKVPEIYNTLQENNINNTPTPVKKTNSNGSNNTGSGSGNITNGSNNSNSVNTNNSSSGYKAVHTIVAGDTLWALAVKYYGDGTKWTKIQKANNNVDPYNLQIGKKLYIPYKKGTKKVPENQLALTDEAGEELILRANEKGNLQMLTKGSSVIPADLTENLMKWGEMNPDLLTQNLNVNVPSVSIPNFKPKEITPVVNIGDININGNMGNLTKSDLNEFRKGIVNDVYESMQKNRVKSGRY